MKRTNRENVMAFSFGAIALPLRSILPRQRSLSTMYQNVRWVGLLIPLGVGLCTVRYQMQWSMVHACHMICKLFSY